MPVHNADVVAAFDEIADLLEISGANHFRVRAYRTGARTVEGLTRSVAAMVEEGEPLQELPGIGADLADKIEELVRTGDLAYLHKARKRVPEGLVALLRVPGLGPKRVKLLHDKLGVTGVESLRAAVEAGRVQELPGFGEKTAKRIGEGLERALKQERRFRLDVAAEVAEALSAYLRAQPGVGRLEVTGSYRRRRETVGDLDVLTTARDPVTLMDAFVGYDAVRDVISKGKTRSSVRLASGMQVDLRVVEEAGFGAAMHYFTGSKGHNIAVRRRGVERGLKINEYGVFRGDARIAGRTEEEVFEAVDLAYVPPELREDRGEIAAAEEDALPKLVTLKQMRGDLQMHTTDSDGRAGLDEMVEAARALGHKYIAITDHSPRLRMTGGLDARRLKAQGRRIDKLNDTLDDITVLKGIEVDILKDGSLDLPDGALAQLDVVVASVHSHFGLPRDEQTARVLRAMENPHVHVLGHPTGRILMEREPLDLDMERLLDAAAGQGWFPEVNAQPNRLDLADIHARMAKERGVKVVVSTDAHTPAQLSNLRYGVDQARRAWLERKDVVNARTLNQLRKLLKRG